MKYFYLLLCYVFYHLQKGQHTQDSILQDFWKWWMKESKSSSNRWSGPKMLVIERALLKSPQLLVITLNQATNLIPYIRTENTNKQNKYHKVSYLTHYNDCNNNIFTLHLSLNISHSLTILANFNHSPFLILCLYTLF